MDEPTNDRPRFSTGKQTRSNSLHVTLGTLTQSNSLKKVKEFLEANPNVSITKVRDNRLYTVLHMACINSQHEIASLFFTYVEANNVSKEEIRDWVNTKTDEGFTAIHFAAFKGNIALVELLEQHGADITLLNNRGLNVVHISAQGDRPVSLAYFKKKGISLFEKDTNGSTPLHWAAYFGMENSTHYLTSWGASVNEIDDEFGCTPLHLAVNSGNFKVVKRLLLKGADKEIKNKEGKIPLDIAVENDYEGIIELLQKTDGIASCLGVKPGTTRNRTFTPLIFFIVSLTVLTICAVLFVFPYVFNDFWIVLISVLLAITYLTFIMVWFKDPGYVQNKESGDILKLLLQYDPHRVCPDCIILKPNRSKHCEYCKCCVSVYDHHCPWINNCVGARNYGSFVRFIVSVLISLLALLVFACCHAGEVPLKRSFLPLSSDLLFGIKELVCAIIFVFSLCFIFPLIGLNYLHLMNLATGLTTHERFSYSVADSSETATNHQPHQRPSLAQSLNSLRQRSIKAQRRSNKFFSLLTNCKSMCFTNAKDERYNSTTIELIY